MAKLIDLLTSCDQPRKSILMGNEAVARGAIEAGVKGIFAYPGTPSTEISEVLKYTHEFQTDPNNQAKHPELTSDPIYFEFSINEKVAMEKAIAYSLGNRPAMCIMKNAGLNVASDPLITIPYQTIGKALVVVVCDDPGCSSSSSEQDSRYYGKIASIPVFNPATVEESLVMTIDAFALSEKLKIPVILRMTTRVDHCRSVAWMGKIARPDYTPRFDKSPLNINIPARTATAHKTLLDKLNGEAMVEFQQKHLRISTGSWRADFQSALGQAGTLILREQERTESPPSKIVLGKGGQECPPSKSAFVCNKVIIASGVASAYAAEIIARNDLGDKIALISVGIIHPFPSAEIAALLKNGCDKILVLEELDPIVENEIRVIAQREKLPVEIFGKGFAGLSPIGEYGLGMVSDAIEQFSGISLKKKRGLPAEGIAELLKALPPRPPVLCPGCPHRATFYALKLAMSRGSEELVLCGDIGCFGLGALPPFQLIETINHMGMSISMAQGLSEAMRLSNGSKKKMIALVGDGTFFHSGISSLLNAVYTQANITLIIFDNRTIGMTGQQYHPGAVDKKLKVEIDLPNLLKGLGVDFVETIDPNEIPATYEIINKAVSFDGVAVVITKSPCVFLPEFTDQTHNNRRIIVDPSLCNVCHNQIDGSIFCCRVNSAAGTLAKARAKISAGYHILASEQACPANICNHGFFNAVLQGDYKTALNIVRDKTLFARICGEICPRPCEFLYREKGLPVIPIRKLKEFISKIDTNFDDFSVQKARAAVVVKKDFSIAVVGAGPSGLSAAYDLIQAGYAVTIFEKEFEPGGILKFVIPDFRLDKEGYAAEISLLCELGVQFKYGVTLGIDYSMEELCIRFDAVILAIGMGLSTTMEIIEHNIAEENRFEAISFLRLYNQEILNLKTDATMFVIGGGNSAIDVARAARDYGVKDVVILYRRTRDEMPAFDDEVEAALTEGVQIIFDTVVDDCRMTSDGRVEVSLKSFKDGHSLGKMVGDYIVAAVGQRGDVQEFRTPDMKLSNDERIISDPETGQTSNSKVFVAGDISSGNHVSLIGAIGSGKKAANGVRKLLEGYQYDYEGLNALDTLNAHLRVKVENDPFEHSELTEANVHDLMAKFDLYQPCAKCDHCIETFGCPALIKVNGKVVIDEDQCNRCGLCIEVCLNNAIRWVETENQSLEGGFKPVLQGE